MKLEHAFFPPNSPPSVVVDVNYHITADLKNFLLDELFFIKATPTRFLVSRIKVAQNLGR